MNALIRSASKSSKQSSHVQAVSVTRHDTLGFGLAEVLTAPAAPVTLTAEPDETRATALQRMLDSGDGPVVAVTDFVKLVPDQVASWMPRPFVSLGTDGYGLSDTRTALRRHFETDAAHIVVATLWGLFLQGDVKADTVIDAARRYDIDLDLPDPYRS